MYIKSMKGWSKHLDFLILDVVMLELTLIISYGIRHAWSFRGFGDIYKTLAFMLATASIVVGVMHESYHDILRRDYICECRQTILHVTIVEALLIAAAFFLKEFSYSREVFLLLWTLGIILCVVERCIWKQILKAIGLGRQTRKRQVLLVTVPEQAARVMDEWKQAKVLDCEICGIYLTGGKAYETSHEEVQASSEVAVAAPPGGRDTNLLGNESKGDASAAYAINKLDGIRDIVGQTSSIPIILTVDAVLEYLVKHVVDEVLIRPGSALDREQMDEFLQAGLTVHMDIGEIIHMNAPTYVEEFADGIVITTAIRMVRPWEMWMKRLMDIMGSCVGLFITGIACIFVVPAIKLADPGPAFFSQIRVGKNGRRFRMYKFRSMYTDAEERKKELLVYNEMKGAMFKMKNDPRIIKGIGTFIRKTSIDELPQFWNVLKGDMSLVGTRPPTEEEYDSYEMRYLRRLSVRPGITGVWQTSGRNQVCDFDDVVKLDTEYIVNWSLSRDIRLLLKTVRVVFMEEGAV